MKSMGVNRVVIAVKDIKEAGERYSNLLGVTFWDAGAREDFGLHALVSWDGGVELIMPLKPDGAVARFLAQYGEAVYAVAFRVADIKETETSVKSKGMRIVGTVDKDESGTYKFFKELIMHPADTRTGKVSVILVQADPK
ncbi:MAG: VOC family protein [Chloroflexi bacterium]|nr:VOC family protein [Chloroflexota bacterium]